VIAWIWLACARTGAPAAPPPAVQAGPRTIVETEYAPEPGEGVSIGRNEAVAYVQEIRAAVMPSFRSCVAEAPRTGAPTLVEGRVSAQGRPFDVTVTKSSGDPAVDDCARRALAAAELSPPPPRILDRSGTFELPPFAFVRP